jgi:hypothetical protein
MGQAKIKRLAAGPLPPIRPEQEKIPLRIAKRTADILREGHARLTQAQQDRKLPTVSWDAFLENMMIAGLERLSQSLAGKLEQPKIEQKKMVLTPFEAHRELVMADAVQDQRGRRTVGAVPMFHKA